MKIIINKDYKNTNYITIVLCLFNLNEYKSILDNKYPSNCIMLDISELNPNEITLLYNGINNNNLKIFLTNEYSLIELIKSILEIEFIKVQLPEEKIDICNLIIYGSNNKINTILNLIEDKSTEYLFIGVYLKSIGDTDNSLNPNQSYQVNYNLNFNKNNDLKTPIENTYNYLNEKKKLK